VVWIKEEEIKDYKKAQRFSLEQHIVLFLGHQNAIPRRSAGRH